MAQGISLKRPFKKAHFPITLIVSFMDEVTMPSPETSRISSLLPSHQPHNASLGNPNPPNKGHKTTMKKHPRTRLLGVRQRPSGRWVAEIKDSSLKLRLWLGTFDRAEEAALAYDSAARLLRGRNARTNFPCREQVTVNSIRLQANPRFHRLLSHASTKQLLRSSLNNAWRNGGKDDDNHSMNFDAVVEETIVCTSEDGIGCLGCTEEHDGSRNNKICGVSVGSSKVYSSVVVAPSFSRAS